MEFRQAEGKGSPKRELPLFKARTHHRNLRSNVLESIAQANGGSIVCHTNEDGVVRMKLIVKKQDLRQMLELIRHGNCKSSRTPTYNSSSISLEQRLNLLLKKRSNAMKSKCQGSWTPALQSIPEEF